MFRTSCILICALLVAPAVCGGQFDREDPPADPEPVTKPVPPTPIAVQKAQLNEETWNPAWTRMIERALPRRLISRRHSSAVSALCPRYRDLSGADRRAFWAYFFQALAGAEAGLKPTADVRHTDPAVAVIDPVTGRIVRQQGLLQLAYEDSRRYGCDFDWARDRLLPEHDPDKTILQPRSNLLCGIRIVENQIVKQHKPLLTDSSYWVTLQPSHLSSRIFLKQMANEPAFCGRPLVPGVPPPTVRQTPPLTQAANRQPAPVTPASAADPPEDDPPAPRVKSAAATTEHVNSASPAAPTPR
jgi:hypothetical protein